MNTISKIILFTSRFFLTYLKYDGKHIFISVKSRLKNRILVKTLKM